MRSGRSDGSSAAVACLAVCGVMEVAAAYVPSFMPLAPSRGGFISRGFAPRIAASRVSLGASGDSSTASESPMELLKNAISGVPITGGYSSVSELFKKFDADKNGQIDSAELTTFFDNLGSHLKEDQMVAMMAMMDTSKDGKVDYAEFSAAIEMAEAQLTMEADDIELSDFDDDGFF